ncbi:hypothetical protein O0I10_010905 [Lichtheimia ornata]|uniref:Uncharacterized protein n=1 Tax=Lichtheimia ornata TaxID=688661 RepID=A0AAD7UTV0_9FUNG|nr:uncharacterized protein O0I10_010905 [Lichtheimia ornata]KAJ8653469.1 hypothetical protein O0I10_010905 [Lichtheimia ornata]
MPKKRPDLEQIQHQLSDIALAAQNTCKHKYSAKEVQHLQNRLHHIDEKYREGVIDDRDMSNPSDDPYEHQGQAQIAEELNSIHQTLSNMLENAHPKSQ